jgi:hypothetical protein
VQEKEVRPGSSAEHLYLGAADAEILAGRLTRQ